MALICLPHQVLFSPERKMSFDGSWSELPLEMRPCVFRELLCASGRLCGGLMWSFLGEGRAPTQPECDLLKDAPLWLSGGDFP